MNIASQDSITIQLDRSEIKDILLDYIKRVAGGVVDRDMEILDTPFDIKDVTFSWQRMRNKEVK